ncbi:hypothetical protein BSLG_004479 [Batrachochytrium salamandrivorans]|nr:hypothetical protein BSLG_004479 [Batrachochytrium salamandrivorans]
MRVVGTVPGDGDCDSFILICKKLQKRLTSKRKIGAFAVISTGCQDTHSAIVDGACVKPVAIPVYVRYAPLSVIPADCRDDALVSNHLATILWPDGPLPTILRPYEITFSKLASTFFDQTTEPTDLPTAYSITFELIDYMNYTKYEFLNTNMALLSLKLSGRLLGKGMTLHINLIDGNCVRLLVANIVAQKTVPVDHSQITQALEDVDICFVSASVLIKVLPRASEKVSEIAYENSTISPPWFPGLEPAFRSLSSKIEEVFYTIGNPTYQPDTHNARPVLADQCLQRVRGILLSGEPGTGKSHLIRSIARYMGVPWSSIDAIQLIKPREGDFEHLLLDIVLRRSRHPNTHSIIIIDNLEDLINAGKVPICGLFKHIFDDGVVRPKSLSQSPGASGVLLIAVTNKHELVKKHLGVSTIYFEDFRMPPLTVADRVDLFRSFIPDAACDKSKLVVLAKQTRSHALSDLVGGLQRGILDRVSDADRFNALCNTLKSTPPASLRGIANKDILIKPFREYDQDLDTNSILRIQPPHGVLIYGPHGVGKTLLACAVANELAFPCIFVDGPSIRSKLVGESEKAISKLFQRARASAPCILLIDQIEHLLATRSEHSSSEGSSNRVVTSFLTELDGVIKHTASICVLATSRLTKTIDPAVLRPGRIGAHIHIPLPNRLSRSELFQGLFGRMPTNLEAHDIESAIDRSEGMSQADIAGICREAAMASIRTGASCVMPEHLSMVLDSMTNTGK